MEAKGGRGGGRWLPICGWGLCSAIICFCLMLLSAPSLCNQVGWHMHAWCCNQPLTSPPSPPRHAALQHGRRLWHCQRYCNGLQPQAVQPASGHHPRPCRLVLGPRAHAAGVDEGKGCGQVNLPGCYARTRGNGGKEVADMDESGCKYGHADPPDCFARPPDSLVDISWHLTIYQQPLWRITNSWLLGSTPCTCEGICPKPCLPVRP